MKHYKEIATRFHVIDGRKINEGDVTRVVAISERDAKFMNETEESRDELQGGQKYKYVELTPEEDKARDQEIADKKAGVDAKVKEKSTDSAKESRALLFAKATELGLTPPKNISTEKLEKLIEETEGK